MRTGALGALFSGALALSGCAGVNADLSSVTDAVLDPNQTLSIETDPPEAACRLLRGTEDLGTLETPGSIGLTPSRDDILVVCEKPHYRTAAAVLHADAARPGAAAGSVAGWPSDMRQPPRYRYAPTLRLTLTAAP